MSKKGKGKAEKTAPEGGGTLMYWRICLMVFRRRTDRKFHERFPHPLSAAGTAGCTSENPHKVCLPLALSSLHLLPFRPGAPPTGDTPTTPSVFLEEGVGPGFLRAIHLRSMP